MVKKIWTWSKYFWTSRWNRHKMVMCFNMKVSIRPVSYFVRQIHSSPPGLKLGRLCNALKNFSSVIPEAWIINRGLSLNTSNTRILLVFNHPVDCLVQAVYFCSGQNSKLWTMGQECQSSNYGTGMPKLKRDHNNLVLWYNMIMLLLPPKK